MDIASLYTSRGTYLIEYANSKKCIKILLQNLKLWSKYNNITIPLKYMSTISLNVIRPDHNIFLYSLNIENILVLILYTDPL